LIIKLKELVGEHLSCRYSKGKVVGGDAIQKMIEDAWAEEKISIDLTGVKTLTPSFVDEAFAKLLYKHSFLDVKAKLSFIFPDDQGILKSKINRGFYCRQIKLTVKEDKETI
jgi:hypothetical protein